MTHHQDVDPGLARLADAYGVATSYEDQQHRLVHVAPDTVVAVLAALGVDAATPAAVTRALDEVRLAPLRRLTPPTVVVRASVGGHVDVHPPEGVEPRVRVDLEGGRPAAGLTWLARFVEPVEVDGAKVATRTLVLPAGLPLGWHRLHVSAGDRSEEVTLVVTPDRLELPAGLGRAWGWMVQLYAVRSAASWGMGDFADLAELCRWSGAEQGAGLLMCNPLHAVAPLTPVENSPYYPASRRFTNPLYLRVEATAEYAAVDPDVRARVDALGAPARALDHEDRIDRDVTWTAKRAALELLWAKAPRRVDALSAYRDREGPGVDDFATWSALAEEHGRDWRRWPEGLRHPGSPEVAAARARLGDRVDFHAWLQLLCDEQLAAAQQQAVAAGMRLGVVHDLAVGVDPGGPDAWALQDALAITTTVGAPPDAFNQQGQDWQLPPWRPDRLAELGYAPYRDMLRSVLRHAGGVRVDHVLGLFRLWWVPAGHSADRGTYVRYDEEALLGVLALEAHRAGAVVVGEDLGTVEPRVQQVLRDRGLLGSAVLWFERAEHPRTRKDLGPRPLREWRQLAMASVTTHDLPTAAGFLRLEHVRVRAELGQLAKSVEEERDQAEKDRADVVGLLRREGLVGPDATEEEVVLAMHRALTRTPSRLVVAALGDAVGDLRQPNLPGTVDEYPNWRLPVAVPGPDGHAVPLTLEELQASAGVARLAEVLRKEIVFPSEGTRRSMSK